MQAKLTPEQNKKDDALPQVPPGGSAASQGNVAEKERKAVQSTGQMEEMTSKLYDAAASGNVAALKEIGKQKIDVLAQVFPGGNTALHISAYHGHLAFVKVLLEIFNEKSDEEAAIRFLEARNSEKNSARNSEKNSTLDITDQEGRTALHYAVENAHIQVVIILVKAMGMRVNIADNNGYTALDIADQKYDEDQLSPYFAIRLFLRRKYAIAGKEAANQTTRETSKPNKCERYSARLDILSVCAIFIATVTFQAAFTLPHRSQGNDNPDPLTMSMLSAPMSTFVYRKLGDSGIFLIFDALAFGLSIVAIIILAYVRILCRYRSCQVVLVAIILPFALYMMIAAFSFAILIQLGPERYVVASIINYGMVFVGFLLFVFLPIAVLNVLGIIQIIRACLTLL